ncbi:hypothetical protein COOONC_14982 [Cooperia oncophora]
MSSVGHTKARRPSLVEFHDAMKPVCLCDVVVIIAVMSSVKKKSSFKRQQIAAMRYHAVDIDGPPYLIAHFPDCGDTSEKIPLEPGLKLYQVFEGTSLFYFFGFKNRC